MIIGACGYGGTGSSAIKDFLKEFEDVQVLDRAESMFAFKVDGLQDLEYHLVKQYSRQISGDIAIKRFRDASKYANTPFIKKLYLDPKRYKRDTDEFLNSLTQTTYRGMDNYDYETNNTLKSIIYLGFKKFVVKYYEKWTGKIYTAWPMRDIHISIHPEGFYEKAKKYMRSIIENGGGDFSKIIVLDQPFEGNNPTQSFPFFEDPYAIIIDRDPRDLYMAASYQWPDGMFMPRRDPEAFVEYYKRQRMNIQYSDDNERVLRLNLESMIFDYDNTIKTIMEFLGLTEETHINPKKYFNPKRSIKGSQVYKKIKGHEQEIAYIEKALSEYLFDFDSYELSKTNTEINQGFKWDKDV
jgi:hypothetical protein